MNGKFRRLFRIDNDGRDVERAVDDELVFHFEMAVRDLVTRGATEEDARKEAERRFGDVERTRHSLTTLDHARVRESQRAEWWSNVRQDLRYALRGMRRKPGFTIAVVLILALGIGANATMFGIVDRLLLRPPAYLARDRQVQRVYLATNDNGRQFFAAVTSLLRFHDLTDSLPGIDAAVAYSNPTLAVGITDAQELHVTYATAGIWKFFQMQPELGRFFTTAEDADRRGVNVAVVGNSYWRTALAAREDVLGQQIRLGRFDYTIVGVAPKGFAGFADQEPAAFVPLSSGAENSFPGNGTRHWYNQYGFNWLSFLVRRRPDVSPALLTAELTQRFQASYAAGRKQNPEASSEVVAKPHAVVAPVLLGRGPNQSTEVKVSKWLVGVALIVLVIAGANVGNLFLARALQRRREIAVRLALGISRRRLISQFLSESVLLALMGSAAGLLVTEWGGGVLRATLLPGLGHMRTIGDGRTLVFAAIIALVAGTCTGLVPALASGDARLTGALRAGQREGTYRHSRLQSTLLVLQGALSVVLLVGAGLFVRSLDRVQQLRLGYDAENVAWISPHMRGVVLDSARERVLFDEVARAAAAVPGVQAVSYGLSIPFTSEWEEPLFVPGIDSVRTLGTFQLQVISPTYFRTLGTRIIRGRAVDEHDRAGAPGAIVVSQSMAARLWPGKDALSRCVRMGADTMPCRYVVGIAEDIKSMNLADDEPFQYYVPYAQYASGQGGVVFVRSTSNVAPAVEALRTAVQTVMLGASYVTVSQLSDALEEARRSWQLGATMFTLFGALALIVASVGLYSVVSYSVAQRTQEMGVRVALGAGTRDVMGLVLRQSVSVSVLAIALGTGAALLASRWVQPLLFETSPRDPLVYGGVATVLLAVAFVAALLPALRAARIDPNVALRSD